MNNPVFEEEIVRFDGLYHKILRANSNSDMVYPEELRRLMTVDISVLSLAATNPSIIIREIAGKLGIPNSTLTSAINRLEKQYLARRVISPRDRRSFCLELTQKGWAVQKLHTDFEKAYFRTILGKLPSSEKRKSLMDLLEIIANADASDINGDETDDGNT